MEKRLYRSRTNRKLFGVCGGLGEYFEIDPTVLRLIVVIAAFCSIGTLVLAYIVASLIMPEQT